MRKLLRFAIVLLIVSSVFNSCTNDSEIDFETENQSKLLHDFENHLLSFKANTISKSDIRDFSKSLDFSKNYEESIYFLIANRKSKSDTPKIIKNTLDYSNHSEFDKYFLQEMMNSYKYDDISLFFDRVDHYQNFINSTVNDLSHKEYLNNAIEQFKWIKYSIHSVQKLSSSISKEYNEGCFDDCMENSIDDQFDTWTGWAQFIVAPGPVVAWMAAKCIESCHF